MEFNLKNNKYSTEFKNKPKFKPISHKLFSNEKLKNDSNFIKFGLQKRDRKTSLPLNVQIKKKNFTS